MFLWMEFLFKVRLLNIFIHESSYFFREVYKKRYASQRKKLEKIGRIFGFLKMFEFSKINFLKFNKIFLTRPGKNVIGLSVCVWNVVPEIKNVIKIGYGKLFFRRSMFEKTRVNVIRITFFNRHLFFVT